AECDKSKIRGSNDNEGACAPYRRLNLCVRNLENININKNINNDNLLADVCLAALHEGQSITQDYPKYQAQYTFSFSPSQICTMLARSFADIGDIIRGKDLYRGNNGKDKLEDNLKRIFQKIYKDVMKTSGSNGKLKTRYKDDAKGGHFYQLREDWWNANRQQVWYAITCGAKGSQYFRNTCGSGEKGSATYEKCRCRSYKVPTYFDYVPQYLRWFEEWAEDFCTKRKHKLQNAIKNCREGDNGKKRYCSGNGYNCKETIRAENKLVEGEDCYKCSVSCKPFVEWLDNQQKEFEKQKEKYDDEIKKANGTTTTTKETSNGSINNLYVQEFYQQLQSSCKDVNAFLELLNKETTCKDHPKVEVKGKKADHVDFKNHETNGTFCRTEICEPCPLCGVQETKGNWEPKKEHCANLNKKKNYNEENTTYIPKLTPDKSQKNILQKYRNFCQNAENNKQINKDVWQCHYEKTDKSNICVLQNAKQDMEEQKVTSYYSFFYNSIIEMLNDSIEWKDKLKYCINNKTGKCKNEKCKEYCECYKNWITQKKKELDGIKIHFRKQKDMLENEFYQADPDMTLNITLNNNFLKDIKEAYPVKQQLEKIEELLGMKIKEDFDLFKKETIIDEFLEEELKEAQTCLTTHKEKCNKPQQPPGDGAGRSGTPAQSPAATGSDGRATAATDDHADEGDEDDPNKIRSIKFEDEEGIVPHFKAEVQESSTAETPKQDTQVDETEATDTSVEVCKIVDDLFKDGDPKDIFKDACNLKYSGNNSRLGWKCIPTSGVSTTTSGSGGEKATGGDTTGSICVPPRRRRLYIHDLQSLIGKDGTTPTQEDLLKWFVKSAAVETFFLWHRYKKENTKKTQAPQLPLLGVDTVDGDPDDPQSPQSPQSKLQKSGNIPPDFLRLMFYTLGDYRDILFSGIKDEKNGYNDILRGDNVIQEREENINTAIESVFKPSGSSPPAPDKKNTPKDWWDQNGQHIWNAMVCALTYDTNTTSGKTTITQDGTLKEKLLDNNNKPKTNAGPKSNIDYTYEKVELKEDEGGPKTNEAPTSQTTQSQASGENPPKLSDFVLRPTYFRYLEEWGETFCRQRARMLGKIKYEC
ncbi:hypothetical protein PFBG_05995, partial [Plasmodium falciparum 7G8]